MWTARLGRLAPRAQTTDRPRSGAAADLDRHGRAWSDARVTAHHAIIPTACRADGNLDQNERALYELVARRFVQQFLPAFEYLQTRVEVRRRRRARRGPRASHDYAGVEGLRWLSRGRGR